MTPLQLINFAAFALLAALCLWACRVQPSLRPWALALFLWAINGVAFYVTYAVLDGRMPANVIIFWSALVRFHAVILAFGSLMITVKKMGRHE